MHFKNRPVDAAGSMLTCALLAFPCIFSSPPPQSLKEIYFAAVSRQSGVCSHVYFPYSAALLISENRQEKERNSFASASSCAMDSVM